MKPKIGIDLDDVLNNLVNVWIKKYNKFYNDKLKIEDIKTWDIQEYAKHGIKIFDILKEPGICYNLDPQPNSQKVIDFLQNHADVYIVTATYPDNFLDKVKWLNRYFPSIKINDIIICHNKSLLELDYLIDDNPKNMIGLKGKGILFTKPWNLYLDDLELDFDYIRKDNWIDIGKYFAEQFAIREINDMRFTRNLTDKI
jgi:5'(3')-deoxyribonucleotidase